MNWVLLDRQKRDHVHDEYMYAFVLNVDLRSEIRLTLAQSVNTLIINSVIPR
jgi:hypothetical protein